MELLFDAQPGTPHGDELDVLGILIDNYEQEHHRIEYPDPIEDDTVKQLLVRSRYLLFKHPRKWSEEQRRRADILFTRYTALQRAYGLATRLGEIYRTCTSKEQAFKKLVLWYNEVEASAIDSFKTVARSIQEDVSPSFPKGILYAGFLIK